MYIGGYLFLIVLGALLRWAVTYSPSQFSIQTAGLIIMLVGILGLLISILFWFDGRGYAAPWHRGRYVDREYPGPHERVVHEHIVRDEPPQDRIVHEHVVRDEPPRERIVHEQPPPDRVVREYVPPPRDEDDTYDGGYDRSEDETGEDTLERTPTRPPATRPRAR